MSKPYLLPERKSTRDQEIEAARAGLERVGGELKALEKKMCHRTFGRNASVQEVKEAKALHQRLLGGADFAELARLHSGDRSAAQGGQMDYTHRGMLPDGVHGVVDKLKPREIAEPVQLLEGVVILRLDDRKPTVQRSFDQVKVRAAELWQRQEAESQWKKLIAELRRATPIRVDESLYAPLPPSSERPRAS